MPQTAHGGGSDEVSVWIVRIHFFNGSCVLLPLVGDFYLVADLVCASGGFRSAGT